MSVLLQLCRAGIPEESGQIGHTGLRLRIPCLKTALQQRTFAMDKKAEEMQEGIETTATVEEPEMEVAHTEVENDDTSVAGGEMESGETASVKISANLGAEADGMAESSKLGIGNDNSGGKNETYDFGQEPSNTSIYPKEEAFFETCPLAIIDEVYNKVDDYLNDAFDDIEKRLVLNAGTISISRLEEMLQSKRNSNDGSSSSSTVQSSGFGGLKSTLPKPIRSILETNFKMNVEGIQAISFKVAMRVIKFLGMSEVVTIDDLAHEDVKVCQDIREKLDHVLDKVNLVYDKNFDKFEMYSLRNIFRIPDDLGDKTKVGIAIDGGSAHNDGDSVVFTEADEKRVDDRRYQLLHQIVSLRRENKRSARKLCSQNTHLFFPRQIF